MREIHNALSRMTSDDGAKIVFCDEKTSLSRVELMTRVIALAEILAPQSKVIGILISSNVDWVVAQLAGVFAGKTVVPLPTFFSSAQLAHIVRDASIGLILSGEEFLPLTAQSGIAILPINEQAEGNSTGEIDFVEGFSQIIYTSGSTNQPKGVRLGGSQIERTATALAQAIGANEHDSYLSILPLPLLLETICAIFVPLLVGAKSRLTDMGPKVFDAGNLRLAQIFETALPTTCVLVPQLLSTWVEELSLTGRRAPVSLRFVAVGGAPVPSSLAESAWALGIPAHEGYGLSECCSVVALNRIGSRKAGTVGQPLAGLRVSIEDLEIIVEGPSVMDGYLNKPNVNHRWPTGDLGEIDDDGYLTVHGRKDNLLVTSSGRNVSPEWIETMLLSDQRIAFCAVIGHGEPSLTALIVPSLVGRDWFAEASCTEVIDLIAKCCIEAPLYAVPKSFLLLSLQEVMKFELMTPNGRMRRTKVNDYFEQVKKVRV